MYVSLCSNTAGEAQAGSSVWGLFRLRNQTAVNPEESALFFGRNESAELKKLGSEGAMGRERKGDEVGREEVEVS